jgi:xanthine dehydrogenase accessory factor
VVRRDRPRTWGVRRDFSIGWVDEDNAPAEQWLYRETLIPPCTLWIAGSGHVAQAVAPMAVALDFEVTVFDDRSTFASAKYFPTAAKCRVGAWEELFRESLPDKPAFGLVVTRGHQRDALVLADWIHRPFAFLGMIGSRRKARLIFDQFLEEKLATPEEIGRVACPVGLDIDSRTVPEIAVSIVAQLIQKRAAAIGTAPASVVTAK